jgi:Family of unknown function (DUF5947)
MTRAGVPLAALRRVTRERPPPAAGERCDMCAAPIDAAHGHVVDVSSRALLCTCRPCYLLFTDSAADIRYRAVPERYLSFPDLTLDARAWDELEIPVGLAFLFRNSALGRTVAFYPGPAGATESELPLDGWARIAAVHPELGAVRPDVEALLVRRPAGTCHLVPIDACYELVGRLRTVWRGFDGGAEARAVIEEFFATVAARSRPAGGAPS